jgi:hypothetical protein
MAAVTALIQADSMAFQAESATPVVSTTVTTATGGLLQRLVSAHGLVDWDTSAAESPDIAATFSTTAFLLVASGIKNLYLNNAVALCSDVVVISIQ